MAWPSFNLGRFSPFSGYGPQRQVPISNEDFSYITSDDVDDHRASSSHTRARSHSRSHPHDGHHHRHSAPPDILVLRHKKTAYPLQFPSHSIMTGRLTIGELRASAAHALPDAHGDARRVRLFFRGKNLKEDALAIRDTELRTDDEVLCVVGEPIRGDDDEDEDEGSDSADGQGISAGADQISGSGSSNRKRNRKGRNRKKRNGRGAAGGPSDESSDGTPYAGSSIRAEHLPTPSTLRPPPHTNPATGRPVTPSSITSSKPATSTPQTPLAKLTALSDTFHELASLCEAFIASPPSESKQRDFEHKRLTETILQNVLFKLDAVETEGNDEARTRRKALVREAQTMLTRLDAVVNK